MVRVVKKKMNKPTDKVGNEIKIGSFIVYGHALGRCAGLRIGKVLDIKEHESQWKDEKFRFTVRGIEDGWSHCKPKLCMKNGTLQFTSRIIVLEDEQVPGSYRDMLAEF